MVSLFFFNDTATTEIYTLSLHDALPICEHLHRAAERTRGRRHAGDRHPQRSGRRAVGHHRRRSEEHTSELQSRQYLVCRLLLEKKKYFHVSLPVCPVCCICHLFYVSVQS